MGRRIPLGASDQAELERLIAAAYAALGREAQAKAIDAKLQSEDYSLWKMWWRVRPSDETRQRFIRSRRPPLPSPPLAPGVEEEPQALNGEFEEFEWRTPSEVEEESIKARLPRLWLIGTGQDAEMLPWPDGFRVRRLHQSLGGASFPRPKPAGSLRLLLEMPTGGVLYNFLFKIDGQPVYCQAPFDLSGESATTVGTTFGRPYFEWAPSPESSTPPTGKPAIEAGPRVLPFVIEYDLPDSAEGSRRERMTGKLTWVPTRGWTRMEAEGWGATDIY